MGQTVESSEGLITESCPRYHKKERQISYLLACFFCFLILKFSPCPMCANFWQETRSNWRASLGKSPQSRIPGPGSDYFRVMHRCNDETDRKTAIPACTRSEERRVGKECRTERK